MAGASSITGLAMRISGPIAARPKAAMLMWSGLVGFAAWKWLVDAAFRARQL
jgi:hypothetical protein